MEFCIALWLNSLALALDNSADQLAGHLPSNLPPILCVLSRLASFAIRVEVKSLSEYPLMRVARFNHRSRFEQPQSGIWIGSKAFQFPFFLAEGLFRMRLATVAQYGLLLGGLLLAPTTGFAVEDGFTPLTDGKTMAGWKINETPASWKLEDGAFVANGERSHLFYDNPGKPFKNFELRVDVWTEPGSNGGIYFHTKYQDTGWPKYGFESQVNNTGGDPRKTASIYAVKDTNEPPAKDGEWFTETIIVQGNRVITKINDKVIIDYTEPAGTKAGSDFTRVVDEGTFALQAHDPGSTVKYKNIRVKRLD